MRQATPRHRSDSASPCTPNRGRGSGRRPLVILALAAGTVVAACLRIGEPSPSSAYVTWAAYPETVTVGEEFSFEFAGPVGATTCARLDTAVLTVVDSVIELSARRSTFETLCSGERVSFYEARPIRIESPGRYRVIAVEGGPLGVLVATDSGPFSAMRTIGRGTIRSVARCYLFGPGWASNQRPFALIEAPAVIQAEAGSDRVVHVEGRLVGFRLCGRYGSRPSIRVDTAWVTRSRGSDYY